MPELTLANAARLSAALDKKYQFSHGVDTFRGMIDGGAFAYAEAATVPLVEYNRRKWNRLDARGQAEYQKRLDATKTEYRLFRSTSPYGFTVVPKMVFDHFESVVA